MNLAIIGCGHWGTRWIRTFESAGASVKICCDIDERALKSARDFTPDAILTTSYESILSSREVEAVYIATPPSTHYEIAKKCLLADKHVHVEKPMVTNYGNGLELMKLAEERDRILMVGNTYLYNKAIRKIKALSENGLIGGLKHICLWMTNSLDMWIGKDIRDYDDVVWDLSPHPISMVNYIVGEWPSGVMVSHYDSLHGVDGVESVSANLYFNSGVNVALNLNWLDCKRNRKIFILGEKGAVWCEEFSNRDFITVYMRRLNFSKGYIELGQTKSYRIDVRDTLLNEAKHFLQCISSNSTPITDGMNGVYVVAVIEAIHRSIAQNEPCEVAVPQDSHSV